MPDDPSRAARIRRPEDSLGFLLWQATHGWQRHLEQALAPTGLTHLQFVMLRGTRHLSEDGVSVSQADLARWAHVHPMQVCQVLKTLLAKGLVTRRRRADDARAHQIALSEAGERLAEAAMPLVEQAHAEFFAGLDGLGAPLRLLLRRLRAGSAEG